MTKLIFSIGISLLIMGFKGMRVPFETRWVSSTVDPKLKKKALLVMEQKCNACHIKRKQVIFTEKNMSSQFKAIEYQVFIKMRMPKGRVKLLNDERNVLKNWIDAEKLR